MRQIAGVAGVACLALFVLLMIGAGDDDGDSSEAARQRSLPGGGRQLFPARRVVAFAGAPGHAELGALGIGSPAAAARRLRRQAKPYATPRRPVLPAFELIATIATAEPGADGMYRSRQPAGVIDRYLRAARRAGALLVLDVQPGRADFLTEAIRLRRWLKEPDVGLALDPEWRMQPDQLPGQEIGTVHAGEVVAVASWLSGIVQRRRLPEKLLVVHRFTEGMVERPQLLQQHPGIALTFNADGVGSRAEKLAKYRALVPRGYRAGFKLFFEEDDSVMRPRDVLGIEPQPDLIVYE